MPAKRHPASSRGAWTTPPRGPRPPAPPPPRFNTVRTLWGLALAISGAISGFVTFVAFIDHGRHERLDAIESNIRDLYKASDATRNSAFTDLETADLAEHLEPTAIRGLQRFIEDQTAAASSACATASSAIDPSELSRAHVSRAFRIIATLQAPNHTRHSYPDRVIDGFLVWWHGKAEVVPGPFALDGKDLRGVSLRNVNLRLASFANACLSGADFDSTVLDSARFDSAVLDGARFSHAAMRSSSLVGIHANDITFDHSDLTNANLSQATLTRARFFDADLSCATLGDAILDDAYFSTATVRWTYLGGAQLTRSRQWDEIRDFTGAYVGGARGLPPVETSRAHQGGAVPDTMNPIRWSEAHTKQLEAGGACSKMTVPLRAVTHGRV